MKRNIIIATLALLLFSVGVAKAQYRGSKYYPILDGTSATFRLETPPSVCRVQLFGDFLPGVDEYNLGGSVEMLRDSAGVWTYTAEELAPDFYTYHYVVDGVRTLDSWNLKLVCNYSEFLNSFLVEGPQSRNLDYPDAPRGTLTSIWYDSPQYGGQRHLNVYLPAGYTQEKTYPVLYMIPGGGDDEDTWTDMGRLPQIMDNLLWVGAGSKDMALRSARNLMEALDRAASPYLYYDCGDGHNWRSWRRDLQEFVPLLFRK